jgi:hypothetical protein
MIREFDNKDVNDVIELAERHCQENGTGFGDYDEKELIKLIKQIKIHPDYKGIVLEENHKVIGYACCQAHWNPWNRKKEGLIQYLYIHPSFRNGYKSKSLFDYCEQWFETQDCDYFLATATAFDDNYQVDDVNQEFLDKADQLYGRLMTLAGNQYVKGLKQWTRH